ncbi:MAG: Fe-Mn family superoxide dismutase [Methylovirgula sp.]
MAAKARVASFGSVAKAKEQLIQAGVGRFGSGSAWIALKDGQIVVMAAGNAVNRTAILTIRLRRHFGEIHRPFR